MTLVVHATASASAPELTSTFIKACFHWEEPVERVFLELKIIVATCGCFQNRLSRRIIAMTIS